MKNGTTYISIVDREELVTGVWNPGKYRSYKAESRLSDYVEVRNIERKKVLNSIAIYNPIEYKNIPKGEFLIFNLCKNYKTDGEIKHQVVGQQSLIFGTMRAYLGNVVVTPKASWLNIENLQFPIKSEFVEIVPKDGLVYFWWSYLKSSAFLSLMPAGDGGTRPRANPEMLLNIPVIVPSIEIRKNINEKLLDLAEQAWVNYIQCLDLISNFNIYDPCFTDIY